MTILEIRDVTEADFSAITLIYADEVLNGTATYELLPPDRAEMWRRYQGLAENGYPYIVATDASGALLGYAYAGPYRTRPAYNWIVENSIYLSRPARGQGVGSALLEELVARCERLAFRQMIAVIGGADNQGSIRLHAKFGFEPVGTLKATGLKFGRWIDTVLMQRPLGEAAGTIPEKDRYPGTIRL